MFGSAKAILKRSSSLILIGEDLCSPVKIKRRRSKHSCLTVLFPLQAKQHMEPILFCEKFVDWPESTRIIRMKQSKQSKDDASRHHTTSENGELVPYNAELMLDNQLEDAADLLLEGCHLGRGVEYYDEAERRLHKVRNQSAGAIIRLIVWEESFLLLSFFFPSPTPPPSSLPPHLNPPGVDPFTPAFIDCRWQDRHSLLRPS